MLENIVEWQARSNPEGAAILGDAGEITYARLARDVAVLTTALHQEDLPPGLALIVDTPPALHWLLTLALERLGHPTCFTSDGVAEIARLVRPAIVIAPGPISEDLTPARVLTLTPEWRRRAFSQPPSPRRTSARADDLVRIILSSGTTGQRKQVPISRGVMDSRLCRPQMFNGQEARCTLGAMGLDTIGGFQRPLMTWLHGGVAVMPTTVAAPVFQGPNRPTHMVISPARLRAMLPLLAGAYSAVDPIRIRVAGSATPPTLIREVAAQPGLQLFISYGSTEAGTIAWGPSALALRRPGAVGYLTPWTEVEILDDEGRPLSTGASGVIRIRSPDVVGGYVGEGPGSGAFKEGWFYPNDIGHMDADGVLVIDGRLDDVVNIGGLKLSSARVEETLLACTGVNDAAVVAFPMTSGRWAVHAAIVAPGGYDPEALRSSVMAAHAVSVVLVEVEAIPRNGMGKIVRAAVKAAILEVQRAIPA